MNNIKRLFVFTEADIPSDPRKSKGATTRLIARIAEQIKQQERLEVIYCCVHSDQEVVEPRVNIITNPNAFVNEYDVGSADAGIFIRYNFEEMLPVLLAFKQRQGISIAHLSDPHVENTAPTMQARVRLHQKVLSSVDGVIATSEALGAIAKKYNKNVVHIPDVIDFSGRLPPKTAFIDNCLKQNLPIKLLSSGYALHHQSFKKALLEVQSFCESEQIKVDYHIVTAEPNTTDKFTHGNHFKKLEKIVAQLDAQSKLRVYLHAPFRTEILEWLLEVVDVSVIPGFANEFLSEFQQAWFPKKGAIRVTQGIAAGLPVIVTEQFPASYEGFLNEGEAVISAKDVSSGLRTLLSYDRETMKAMIVRSQERLFSTHDLDTIAQRYFDFIGQLRK